MTPKKTFLEITNRDIYNRLVTLDKKLDRMKTQVAVNSASIAIIILTIAALIAKVF